MKELLTGFNKVAVIKIGAYETEYNFALYDDTIKAGDKVFVTGVNEGKILTIDRVIPVEEIDYHGNLTAEVITKVDTTDYDNRVFNRKRKAELIAKMDKMIEKNKDVDKYRKYADILGGDMAKMFEEFEKLN